MEVEVNTITTALGPASQSSLGQGVIRLTYFSGYGLAEQTRWMLAAAKISFEQATAAPRTSVAPWRWRSKRSKSSATCNGATCSLVSCRYWRSTA